MTAGIEYKGIRGRTASNTRGVRTYQHEHLYNVTDKLLAREYVIGSQPQVPLIGSQHPDDPEAWCESLQVRMVTMFAEWAVTANYTTERELSENPLWDPAEIEWDGENFEEIALYDRDGDAILNSAGDPFENVMRERTRRVVSIVKNVASIPTWIINSEDAVNSVEFELDGVLIPIGKAKLGAPRIGRRQVRNGVKFRQLSMSIKLNKDGWDLQPLDAGYRYRNGSSELVRATSDDGTDVTMAVPLNGSGGLLADPTPSTAVFGSYDVYPAFDFSLLPLT
jgi:hypothetical protein